MKRYQPLSPWRQRSGERQDSGNCTGCQAVPGPGGTAASTIARSARICIRGSSRSMPNGRGSGAVVPARPLVVAASSIPANQRPTRA
jgi:hypothetical protein